LINHENKKFIFQLSPDLQYDLEELNKINYLQDNKVSCININEINLRSNLSEKITIINVK
jgi:hypothetical protein